MRPIVGVVVCTLLACGGGGGGGDSGSWLTFTPNRVELTLYQGESTTVRIEAVPSKVIEESLEVAIMDAQGVIEPVQLDPASDLEYVAQLEIVPTLPVGVHVGSFEVWLCRDSAVPCADPYPGSPWRIPYRISVQEGTNLTPLSGLAGATPWTSFQGNAAHTGHVAGPNLDGATFTRRWGWAGDVLGMAVEGGHVFVVTGDYWNGWTLKAISEADGQTQWSYDFEDVDSVSPPATGNGRVYVASGGHENTAIWVIDQATGTLVHREAMSAQWPRYGAPAVYGSSVYSSSGYYGGMVRFDDTTLETAWFAAEAFWLDHLSPAADGKFAYVSNDGRLRAFDVEDGSFDLEILDEGYVSGTSQSPGSVVLGDAGKVYDVHYGMPSSLGGRLLGRLVCYDVTEEAVAWAVDGTFVSAPVLSGSVLYVQNGDHLEARGASTGAFLWSWTLPEDYQYAFDGQSQVVVVGNYAFLRGAVRTYGVNLSTHQSDWSYPSTGKLAVSDNGVLYVARPGMLVAVNLR